MLDGEQIQWQWGDVQFTLDVLVLKYLWGIQLEPWYLISAADSGATPQIKHVSMSAGKHGTIHPK